MVLVWLIFICAVVFDAIGDVYVFLGKMTKGKLFQAAMVASWLTAMILASFLPEGTLSWPGFAYLILMYAFIRSGLFNAIWGHIGLRTWHYLGRTSYFDRILYWITHEITWKGQIIFVKKPSLLVVYSLDRKSVV